jgi:predicted PurR-regulated permease PerM
MRTESQDPPSEAGLQQHAADNFARHSLLALLLAATVVFFSMIKPFLAPVILAAVSVGLFAPLYAWLLRLTRGRRSLGAFVCCATLSLGLLLPAFVVANLASREAVRLGPSAGRWARSLLEGKIEERVQISALARKLHLEEVLVAHALERLAKKGSELLANAIDGLSRGTFELISTLCIAFFTMFYFFRDGPQILEKLKRLSPLANDDQDELLRRFVSVSRATAKGTLLVALIKGILGGLTFWAFGIHLPVLWGAVMVFLSVLPIVGPWLVMYPAALMLILSGHVWQGIAVILIASLIVGLVDNLLEPIIVGRDTGIPELMVFFSILGGIGLFGVMGFLVGPVLAALFLTLLEIYGKEFRQQLTFVHNHRRAGIAEST